MVRLKTAQQNSPIDELNIDNRIEALPVRKAGPVVAGVIVVALAAALLWGVATNPRFEWNIVWKYLFNENVLSGIGYTLLLTVIAMVVALVLAVILAYYAPIQQYCAQGSQLVLYLVFPWHASVYTVGVLGTVCCVNSANFSRYSFY